MVRKHFTVLLLSAAVVMAGCQDEQPSPAGPSNAITASADAATINAMIEDLFEGGNENAALKQFRNIDRKLNEDGDTEDAIDKAFDLIGFIVSRLEEGKLEGSDPEGDAAELILAILEFVGVDIGLTPMELESVLEQGGAVVICEAGQLCNATTGDELSAFYIPAGVTQEKTLVIVRPLSPFVNPFANFEIEAFPVFREFTAFPEIPTNGNGGIELAQEERPIIVELCVVDPPHELAPDPDQISGLRIAHTVSDGETTELDITPLAEIPPEFERPDCTDVNNEVPEFPPVQVAFSPWQGLAGTFLSAATSLFDVAPLYARPGRLGGAISAFSPFGAVDPESQGGDQETTTTLILGTNTLFDSQSTFAEATVSPAPDGQDEPSVDFIIDKNTVNEQTITKFLDGGEASIDIECSIQFEPSGDADAVIGQGAHTVDAEFPGSPGFLSSAADQEIVSCLQIID